MLSFWGRNWAGKLQTLLTIYFLEDWLLRWSERNGLSGKNFEKSFGGKE